MHALTADSGQHTRMSTLPGLEVLSLIGVAGTGLRVRRSGRAAGQRRCRGGRRRRRDRQDLTARGVLRARAAARLASPSRLRFRAGDQLCLRAGPPVVRARPGHREPAGARRDDSRARRHGGRAARRAGRAPRRRGFFVRRSARTVLAGCEHGGPPARADRSGRRALGRTRRRSAGWPIWSGGWRAWTSRW